MAQEPELEQKKPRRNSKAVVLVILLMLFGAQFFQTVLTFDKPSSMFDPNPPVNEDYASMYHLAASGRAFFQSAGKFWGYDPSYMAGFPLSFIWNSNVAIQVFSTLTAPILSPGASLKLFYILGVIFIPFFLFASCRFLGLGKWESLAGTLLGVSYFRMGTDMLLAINGMITGCVVSYLGIFTFALLIRFLDRRGWKSFLALCVFAPLTILMHKTGFVILFAPGVLALVAFRRRISAKVFLALLLAAVLTVAGNWFWLYPLFKLLKYKTFLTGMLIWQNKNPLLPILEYVTPTQYVSLFSIPGVWGLMLLKDLILIGAVWGMAVWHRTRRELFWAMAGNIVFLFLLIFYGSWWRVTAELDPTRYVPVWHLTLCLPAAAGWSAMLRGLGRRMGHKNWVPVSAAVCGLALVNLAPSFWQPIRNRGQDGIAVRTRLHPANQALVQWIIENTDKNEGRIMFEDSDAFDYERAVQPEEMECRSFGELQPYKSQKQASGYEHYGDEIAAALAVRTGRMFVGGLVPSLFLKHHFVAFHDATFLDRDIASYSGPQLRAALELYNIRWAIAWSVRSNKVMACDAELFEYARSIYHYRIYKVKIQPGQNRDYFIRGSGRLVSADYNRLEFEDVVPDENGEVALKFHWLETLASEPEFRLDAYKDNIVGDPIGFIRLRIPAPQPNIVIYNSYRFPE